MTISLNEAIEDYSSLRSGRYTPSTWRAHEQWIEKMRLWITNRTQPNVYLADIDDRLMSDYFKTMRPPRYAATTFNNYRTYGKMFFAFCMKEGWIRTDPMRHIDPQRTTRHIRLQLTPSEMLAMLADASPRDRIALAMGMNTGLRAQDVMTLKVGAVLDTGFLAVYIQKTAKEDHMPISRGLSNELAMWLSHYATETGVGSVRDLPNDWYLIPPIQYLALDPNEPTGPGRRRYEPTRHIRHPEQIVHRALEKLGHPTKQEGFHTLRRSMGRAMFDVAEADGDKGTSSIRVVQAQLGHQNQATTEIYLGLEVDKQARNALLRGKPFLERADQLARERIAGEHAGRDDEGQAGVRSVGRG
jgi:integrase